MLALVLGAAAWHVAPLHRTSPPMMMLGRTRDIEAPTQPDQCKVGDALPQVDVEVVAPGCSKDGTCAVATTGAEILNGTSILFGMPGAFTPTCTDEHLPGIIKSMPEFKALNVSTVAVLTTNDRFVVDAWGEAMKQCEGTEDGLGDVVMLADADANLVRALGLAGDMGFGLGVRSKRFAIVLQDGAVTKVAVDSGDLELKETTAEKMLSFLTPEEVKAAAEKDAAQEQQQQTVAIGAVALAAAAAYYYTTMPLPA